MNNIDEEFQRIKKAALASLQHPGGAAHKLPKQEPKKYPVLYIFRHGETYDNRRRVFSGRRDSKLTEEGIRQTQILTKKLKNKKIDLGISPDLSRCKKTLKIVFRHHPRAKIQIEPRLLERSYGQLTGRSKDKLTRENLYLGIKYRRAYDFPPPGGESFKMVQQRIFPFCQDLQKRMKKEKINVAVSCTNNTMRLIRMFFEKLSVAEMQTLENPLGQDYASYVIQ